MPLHRARVLRATRSPRSKHRAGPLTVATLIFGVSFDGETAEPSFRCQVTLRRDEKVSERRAQSMQLDTRAAELSEDLVDKGYSSKHSLTLPPQDCLLLSLAHNESAVVKRRCVFGEPASDDRLPRWRQKVRKVPERRGTVGTEVQREQQGSGARVGLHRHCGYEVISSSSRSSEQ